MKGFKIKYRGLTKQLAVDQGKVNLLATLLKDRSRFTAVARDRATNQVLTHADFVFKPGESIEITYCTVDSLSSPLVTTEGEAASFTPKLAEFRRLEKLLQQKGVI